MIIIFDMDDTLYDESEYIKSSLTAVSVYLSKKYFLSKESVYNHLIQVLNTQGRGQVFDTVLKTYQRYSKKEVLNCLGVYRRNIPKIKLYEEAKLTLKQFSKYSKYVVSDGNKIVQSIKAEALGLNKFFMKILLTHCYGVKHAKPSTYCFNIIKNIEKSKWNELAYIGDNPNKDFVHLNPLGVKTVRVHTGRFKNQKAKKGYDAIYHIQNLSELNNVLELS